MSRGKLIVASTRLPVTMTQTTDGWQATASAGGLVTALKSVAEGRAFEWFGWAGAHVPIADRDAVTDKLAEHGARPIFIHESDIEGFYAGFSNRVLWPLFHGLIDRTQYSRPAWQAYERVNAQFADAIAAHAGPSDVIWIHDYQLALVPELLRQRGVTASVGYFLHIPFPSSEIYRTLPVREEVLRGILGSDFVGFHAYEYVSHFRKACLRVLGLESDPELIKTGQRRVHLGVLPIGIDPSEIEEMRRQDEARHEYDRLRAAYPNKKIIIGVDRLDYTKGIPDKLLAFEELLRCHAKWRTRCVLVQVAAPSRESVDEYQALKRQVDELVGRINGEFGSPDHTPIVYINQRVSRTRLVGMYEAADVALVTPVRDGMNLVALEYIAARGERGGSLILSEFAGAAYLLPGARLVSPYNISEVAEVLAEELEREHVDSTHMLEFVNENTSKAWASRFLDRLEQTAKEERPTSTKFRVNEPVLEQRLLEARHALVLLDYDGTLRSYERKPTDAVPNERIRSTLQHLAEEATVYVISGRPAENLEQWLGDLPIGLVCEHGFAIREVGGEWQQRGAHSTQGLKRVMPLLEEFRRRTPGAMIERKRSAVAWHYRSAEPEFGLFQANELLNQLEELLRKRPFTVLRGNRVIEVRHASTTKGHAAEELLQRHPEADLVFCAGDDRTDEDMMEALTRLRGDYSVLCWVGGRNPLAKHWTESPSALLDELERLVTLWRRRRRAAGPPSQPPEPRPKRPSSPPGRPRSA
jgi:trehalose 6-phosphate synthase/phosphatase